MVWNTGNDKTLNDIAPVKLSQMQVYCNNNKRHGYGWWRFVLNQKSPIWFVTSSWRNEHRFTILSINLLRCGIYKQLDMVQRHVKSNNKWPYQRSAKVVPLLFYAYKGRQCRSSVQSSTTLPYPTTVHYKLT